LTSAAPGEDLARLGTERDVDLPLADAADEPFVAGVPGEELTPLLGQTAGADHAQAGGEPLFVR
jgi:hypothetical protein